MGKLAVISVGKKTKKTTNIGGKKTGGGAAGKKPNKTIGCLCRGFNAKTIPGQTGRRLKRTARAGPR